MKNECKREVDKEFFEIYECNENNVCKIKTDEIECEVDTFKCYNYANKTITFLAVDNCEFLASDKFKKCDFLLSNENEIVFVELKINTKPKNRKKKRNEAIEQLESCIRKLNHLIKDKKSFAYICFGNNFKIPSTSDLTKKVEFESKTKAILKIECEKRF